MTTPDLLPLPVAPDTFLEKVVVPALQLLPAQMTSSEAKVIILAIGLQETHFRSRQQYNDGPATGFFQFELGGVREVLQNRRTSQIIQDVCSQLDVDCTDIAIHEALKTNDVLTVVMARLLLWCDPHAMPAMDDVEGSWNSYIYEWMPGKPRRLDWTANHALALKTVLSSNS